MASSSLSAASSPACARARPGCASHARLAAAPCAVARLSAARLFLGSPVGLLASKKPAAAYRSIPRVARAAAVVEPATKIEFPSESDGLRCLGAGVREKKIAIINVKVYAVALYVDAPAAKAALAAGQCLLRGDFKKRVTVTMARKVDGPTFWSALEEAVTPRISQIATDQATAEDEDGNFMASVAEAAEVNEDRAREVLQALGDFISAGTLDTGSVLSLTWSPGGALAASFGGEVREFESAEFCQALFDVYVGSDPVSPAAAKSFLDGAAAL